jgi:tetratricopeptide (TPR) repeat protein
MESQENEENYDDFLEASVLNEMLQIIDQIEINCKDKEGQDLINERIKQYSYAKILCTIFDKDITILIKSIINLAMAYLKIDYYNQAQEHLLDALKLYENNNDVTENNKEMQENKIKLLINLSKCYLLNNKLETALNICKKSLNLNLSLFNEDHISNADIYYIISKINTRLHNYDESINNLNLIEKLYKNHFGINSEKYAKLMMEKGQVFEINNKLNEAIDSYQNAYLIYKNKIENFNKYEIIIQTGIKLSELYNKINKAKEGYDILNEIDEKYNDKFNSIKDKVVFLRCKIKCCYNMNDYRLLLKENLNLEKILEGTNENQKTLAKTCISIGYIYLDGGKKDKCLEYLNKALKIFRVNGDEKLEKEITDKINNIMNSEENKDEDYYVNEDIIK